jgi:hypothetical protein
MNKIKANSFQEIPENFTGIVEYANGTKIWYKEGKRHREDGPAVEYADGEKRWWIEGKIYGRLSLNDYVVLDHYQGNYNLMWYKLLDEDKVFEYPDIQGLIEK